jgi:antitoxin component YwqK of YwqJK toxin-antitoxin module
MSSLYQNLQSPEYQTLVFIFQQKGIDPYVANIVEDFIYKTITEYYPNGQQERQYILRFDKLHGDYTEWHENGIVKRQLRYQDGYQHGEEREWYSSGQVYRVRHHVHGKEQGLYCKWTEEGKIWSRWMIL